MANPYLNQMDLEENIKGFTPPEQFLAREQYRIALDVADIKTHCAACNPSRKQNYFNASGVAGFIGMVILAFYEYWSRKGG